MNILYETDTKTLSKLNNEQVQEQFSIHEKLYGEFRNWVETKQKHNENIAKDVMLLFRNREMNYFDIKAEYERRFYPEWIRWHDASKLRNKQIGPLEE
tara:strand:- start:245 stop:538 length:294 start_codon:yes stop_codon:yes gene_type:complete